jgi:hypothetical protein
MMLIDVTGALRGVVISFLYSAPCTVCTFVRPLILSSLAVAALVVRAGAEAALPWGVAEFCDVPKSLALVAPGDKQKIPYVVRPPSRVDSLCFNEVGCLHSSASCYSWVVCSGTSMICILGQCLSTGFAVRFSCFSISQFQN